MTQETYGPHTRAWGVLAAHAQALGQRTIKGLFAADARRFERCSLEAEGLLLDFSRQLLDARALELLLALAQQTEVAKIARQLE